MQFYLAIAAIAYLLGSVPFGFLLAKYVLDLDIRRTGSGNIGATNVARTSKKLGLITLLLDAAKGFVAVTVAVNVVGRELVLGWIYRNVPWSQDPWPHPFPQQLYIYAAVAAFFAIAGHIFPIWLRFRGGKGVATAVGSFLAMDPQVIGLTLALFALLAVAFRFVSLASITAVGAYPAFAYWLRGHDYPPIVFYVLIATAVMIIVRHHANIRRLLAGTEPRFPLKRKAA